MNRISINSGDRFHRLIVECLVEKRTYQKGVHEIYQCRCECGKIVKTAKGHLLSGHTTSCGCSRSAPRRKKALSKLPEYKVWDAMKSRCYNPRNASYLRYGARGIKICDRWLQSFEAFLMDMGCRPTLQHSIDRIDFDGDYTPENCRWATHKEQSNNKSSNVLIEWNNKTQTLSQWTDELFPVLQISRKSMHERLRAGWSVEKAFSTPIDKSKAHRLSKESSPSALRDSTG